MILYLDSSTLVKLYIDEPGSADVARLVAEADAVATSALAYPEVRSTFARRRRARMITPAEMTAARRDFEADWASFIAIPCDAAQARRAGELAEKHSLRGADAMHLAAFERFVSSAGDEDVEFSCADKRLTEAARRLG